MAGDAQQFDVAWIVSQSFHFFYRFSRLNRLDMMAVNAWGDIWNTTFSYALTLASFTKTASPLPNHPFDFAPLAAVQ